MLSAKGLLVTGLLAVTLASADGLQSLESFIQSNHSGKADFTQVVTLPARQGQAARVRTSYGKFEFSRPNRFRFEYLKPFAQSIVADGQTLWLFDVELNQVTVRAQAQALGSTPAALIASAPDIKALQAQFVLMSAPARDGLQWVQATPRSEHGQLQSVRIGLRPDAGGEVAGTGLAALEIVDSFGQRSVLTFHAWQVNPVLPRNAFEFKPPPGADVIRPQD